MKIAYLVLAHKDAKFISRLAKKLTYKCDNDVYIHVDAKADITPFLKECQGDHIYIIDERISVYWGGFHSIKATIALYKAALKKGPYNHYMILQGADYPLWSNMQINEFFSKNKDVEFIRGISETKADRDPWWRYIPHYHLDSYSFFYKLLNHINIILFKAFKKLYKPPYVDIDNKQCEIYRGWAHFALTQKCVEYVVHFYDTHPKYNQFFMNVYAPDESYFHTIIFNSPFLDHTVEGILPESKRSLVALCNLTYFEYPLYVTEFTKKEDYQYLLEKGYPFFRKCSSASAELLDEIDRNTQDV